eukprot:1861419-Rhodomonas_salina.2
METRRNQIQKHAVLVQFALRRRVSQLISRRRRLQEPAVTGHFLPCNGAPPPPSALHFGAPHRAENESENGERMAERDGSGKAPCNQVHQGPSRPARVLFGEAGGRVLALAVRGWRALLAARLCFPSRRLTRRRACESALHASTCDPSEHPRAACADSLTHSQLLLRSLQA